VAQQQQVRLAQAAAALAAQRWRQGQRVAGRFQRRGLCDALLGSPRCAGAPARTVEARMWLLFHAGVSRMSARSALMPPRSE
jgi:hypothetical protein